MAARTMDAIQMLTSDHKEVKGLFKEFESKGDRAQKAKATLYGDIRAALEMHTMIEEEIFYPGIRQIAEELVAEAFEEHLQVKRLLEELSGIDPSDERFEAKMTVLMENVEHHVEEEEKEMFPMVKESMEKAMLDDLGRQMMERRQALEEPSQRKAS